MAMIKMQQQTQINGQMVTLAREYRGLTQSQLAKACHVTQQAIARLEAGVVNAVGSEKFYRISDVLSFPPEFFALNEVRLGFGSSSYFYRKKITTASERNKISGIVNLVRIHVSLMLKAVEVEGSMPLPRLLISDGYTPVKAAENLRAVWNLPDGPILNLTNLVEKAGIIVVECPFGTNSIDGTSLWINGLPPLIFLNDSLPPDRYRFTLAHELGHLVMHDIPHETMENEADLFASSLLMQEIPFKVNFFQVCNTRPTIAKLLQMKPYWKVAVSAMVMRLHQIGKINDAQKRSLFVMLSKNRMNKNEPQPFERERPRFLKVILDTALSGFSEKKEAVKRVLCSNESDFKYLYGVLDFPERPRLRVVS